MSSNAEISSFRALPRTVWLLGFTSLFMDASSEIVHSLLPLFLVAGLGASITTVGLIDGVAEATASITKIFSGALSDWLGHRKWLAVFGYGLSAVTKPLFPLAGGVAAVLVARFFDRLGKGIRGAPRDALVADVTPPTVRGAAYGLRQGLDTVGAVIGPLLAALLMWLFVDDFRLVFWVACFPAVIAVSILAVGVEEPKVAHAERRRFPLHAGELARLGLRFWVFIGVVTVLLLPRFSEAFMLLRGQALGLAEAHVPLILALMNLVAAALSAPAGRLSDSIGRRGLVVIGFAALTLAQGALWAATTPMLVFLGASLWGVHLGVTQGVLSALVADLAPRDLRGTAFGIFNLVSGLAIFIGSFAAGRLWDTAGAPIMFAAAAAVSLCGLAAFLALPADHIRHASAE